MSKIQVSITNYIESVRNPRGVFRTLSITKYFCDKRGDIEIYCGNKSVIFPVIDSGVKRSLKCYFKQTVRSFEIRDYLRMVDTPFLANERWLKDEIYIYNHIGDGSYQDVSICDWLEGPTLNSAIQRYALLEERGKLKQLYTNFKELSIWLLQQSWAHGDIKPENMIVTDIGIVLIDFDAVYLPSFAGEISDEIGTPGYKHPKRDGHFFNIHIDDYPIAIIITLLGALSIEPTLYKDKFRSDGSMFNPEDIINGTSQEFNEIKEVLIKNGEFWLLDIAESLCSETPIIHNLIDKIKRVDDHSSEDNERQLFNIGNKWGYTDSNSQIIIPAIFDTAHEFRNEMAVVELNGVWQYINTDGTQKLVCPWASNLKHFNNGIAPVKVGDKWGYMDMSGTITIEPIYDMASIIRDGIAKVRINNKSYCIDTNRNKIEHLNT